MNMYKKIIVLLDGTEHSEIVLPYALEIAQKCNSQLSMIGICANSGCIFERLLNKYLDDISERYKSEGLFVEKPVLLKDHHIAEIFRYAGETENSLIIMAHRNPLSSNDWPLSNLSEKIMAQATIPLLIVPDQRIGERSEKSKFHKIMVPLDGSDLGAAALPWAKELAKGTNAKLFLLQVLSSTYKAVGAMDYAVKFEKQLVETLRKEAWEYMTNLSSGLEEENVDYKIDLITGTPPETIFSYAENNSIDLIAMSTHGRSGISRFILGSVSQKVVDHSEVPVLLIRAYNKSRAES
jgi:nucleotide-binding universal stress UspA family protein